jgi:hypothetical protein
MTTSHRLRTSAGAAALAAALVLVPTAAFADDAPAAPVAVPDATPAVEAPAVAPADAPASDPSGAPTDASAPAPVAVAVDVDAVAAAPSAPAAPQAEAPATPATPSTRGAGTVVVVAPETAPYVEVFPGAAHPGSTFSVYVQGFTPGDVVSARVDGDAVSPDDVFTVYPAQLPFVFDSDGTAFFDVEVPADLPLGTLTVAVSDAHGLTSSTEVSVTAPIPAPVVVAPVGATAGVVTVSGSGGLPGQAALVVVGDHDVVEEGFGTASASDVPSSADGARADVSSLVTTTAAQAEADPEEIPYDDEPVEYSPEDGAATALVPIAADGTFSARFVLPAGDFATTALAIDTETSDTSLPADVARFTVAAAAAPVVVPAAPAAAPAAVPVNTVVATRGGSLAYTGTETTLPAGVAAAALLLGAALMTTARLRRRVSRRG